MESNRLNFFDDIRDKLLLLAGGLLSMATILQLFFNQISGIFHLSIERAYFIFVFLYFIFPVIFYLLYCSIHDYIGFLKLLPRQLYNRLSPRGWTLIECVLLLYAWAWLSIYNVPLSLFIMVLLVAIGVQLFRVFFRNRQTYCAVPGIWKEFLVLSITVLALFLLFFITNRDKIWKSFNPTPAEAEKATQAFNRYEYSDTLSTYVQKPLDSFVSTSHNSLLEELIRHPNDSDLLTAEVTNEKVIMLGHMIDLVGSYFRDTVVWLPPTTLSRNPVGDTVRLLLKGQGGGNIQYKIYETAVYLQQYARKQTLEKQENIRDAWATRQSDLQWKGLAWLFCLMMASLCLWLDSMNEIAALSVEKGPEDEEYKTEWDKKFDAAITELNDNATQSKTFFYICVLLVIPFFKPVDKENTDLEKPFLNFSVGNVLNQETHLRDPNGNNGKGGGDNSDVLSSLDRIREQLTLMSGTENDIQNRTGRNSQRLDSIANNTIKYPEALDLYRIQFESDSTHKK